MPRVHGVPKIKTVMMVVSVVHRHRVRLGAPLKTERTTWFKQMSDRWGVWSPIGVDSGGGVGALGTQEGKTWVCSLNTSGGEGWCLPCVCTLSSPPSLHLPHPYCPLSLPLTLHPHPTSQVVGSRSCMHSFW